MDALVRGLRRLVGGGGVATEPPAVAGSPAGATETGADGPPVGAPRRAPRAASLVCVYRYDNVAFVEQLLAQRGELRLHAALWALDRPHPRLDRFTLGCGPGGKFDLLNGLLDHVPSDQHLVVADDDVVLARGDLGRLLDLVDAAGFGLAQPAHARRSHATFGVTRRRRMSTARLSTFVEIGPLFVVAPAWRHHVVPFPPNAGLGWGLDLRWTRLAADGCRLGMVDRVTLRHCRPVAGGYDTGPERDRVRSVLTELGVPADVPAWEAMARLQRATATWRPWRRRAPWAVVP